MIKFNGYGIKRTPQTPISLTHEQYGLLSKWLSLLFWLIIPDIIAGVLSNGFMEQAVPFIYYFGMAMSIVVDFLYGFFLFKLSSVRNEYKTAGTFNMILAVMYFAVLVLPLNMVSVFASQISVFGILSYYYEIKAHSSVLAGIDDALSAKWKKLWKWYIIFTVATIVAFGFGVFAAAAIFSSAAYSISAAGLIFALISLVLTGIAIVVCAIVLTVLRLIYLYRTAKIFKNLYEGHNM